jgi:type I restriction enzyme S subunit
VSWRTGPLRRWLTLNDGGVWGDDPTGADDTVVIRSTDIKLGGGWDLNDPARRSIDPHERAKKRLASGDLIVVKSSGSEAHLGKTAIVTPSVAALRPCFANFVQRLRVSREADPRFVWYFLNSKTSSDALAASGSTSTGLRNLNGGMLGDLPFGAPDVAGQRAIADFLDAETTRIDGILARRARQVALLDERWQAAASELIASCGHTRSAGLGVVLARLIDYRGATPEKTDTGVPLITASHIVAGRVQHDLLPQFVSEETRASWMTRGLPLPGDLLLTTEAPLGEVAFLNDTHVALAQRLVLLRPRPDLISSGFLYAYLRSPRGCAELQRRASGSTVMGIRSDRLRSVPVPVPDLRTQAEVARTLQLIQLDGQRLSRSIDRQVSLLKERRQALITAAVTGQLDLARKIAEEVS